MLTDFWSHTFFDDPEAANEVEDDDFDADDVSAQIGFEEPLPDDFEDVS